MLSLIILLTILQLGIGCVQRHYGNESFVCVCNSTYCDKIPRIPKLERHQYVAYTSTKSALRMKQSINSFEENYKNKMGDILITRTTRYQTIQGFGGSMTDAAAINIASLSKSAQNLLLQQYYGEDGSRYEIIRVPIGGTDFSTRAYTLDDMPDDTNLTYFQLAEEDTKYRIPLLQQALQLAKTELTFFACPWSTPGFMKTTKQIQLKGKLLPEFYEVYANYLIKFLQAYKNYGINFDKLSVQNEPLYSGFHYEYNAMAWSAREQAEFIVDYLGPKLEQNNFAIKIMLGEEERSYSYNWTKESFETENLSKYVDSLGVHWYFDKESSPAALDDIHYLPAFAEKDIFYTEAAVSLNGKGPDLGSWSNGVSYLNGIIDVLSHWVVGWVDWNLALDLQGGPNWVDNFIDATIIVNASSGEFYKNPTYYALAHISRFVPPGSKRINLINDPEDILNIAFETPEKGTVIIFGNYQEEDKALLIHDIDRNQFINLVLPPDSFMTIVY